MICKPTGSPSEVTPAGMEIAGFQQALTTGNLATNGALDIVVTHDWSATHADNDARVDALVVSIE